jgi:hypothetical protein
MIWRYIEAAWIDHGPERIGQALDKLIAHRTPSFLLRRIEVRKPSGSLSLTWECPRRRGIGAAEN